MELYIDEQSIRLFYFDVARDGNDVAEFELNSERIILRITSFPVACNGEFQLLAKSF